MKPSILPRACLALLWSLVVGSAIAYGAAPACTLRWDPTFGAPPPPPGSSVVIVRAFTDFDLTEPAGLAGRLQLIVGGGFSAIAGSSISSVAAWDPVTGGWHDMSFTTCNGEPQPVQSLAVYQGELYAGGVLDWTPLPVCNSMGVCTEQRKVTGILARWNPAGSPNHCIPDSEGVVHQIGNWTLAGGEVNAAAVRALAVFDPDDGLGERLYVGGHIPPLPGSGDPARHLFTWNGNTWGTVGDGVDGESSGPPDAPGVWDFLVVPAGLGPEPGLYVAGQFSAALREDGVEIPLTRGIARWNYGAWQPTVGGGLDPDTLQCPVTSSLSAAGAAALQKPSEPDGGGTEPQPTPCVPHIAALELFDDGFGTRLFAGGRFRDIGGAASPSELTSTLAASIAVHNLAAWDGSGWQAVGFPPDDGVIGEVEALEVMECGFSLAVGGQFSTAAGSSVAARNVARWDGFGWSPLNGGLHGFGNFVHALRTFGAPGSGYLYAGGSFDVAENPPDAPFDAVGAARWGCARSCPGDIDLDGQIGITDLLALLAAWGPCSGCPDDCPADINSDGTVDATDEDILLAGWGSCPS